MHRLEGEAASELEVAAYEPKIVLYEEFSPTREGEVATAICFGIEPPLSMTSRGYRTKDGEWLTRRNQEES
jgi:hypothetical protein